MQSWFRLVLAIFACYRLSQYLSLDDGPGDWFAKIRVLSATSFDENGNPTNSLGKLVNCAFCQGVWYAILCAVLCLYPTWLGDFFLLWQGIAGAQACLEGRDAA